MIWSSQAEETATIVYLNFKMINDIFAYGVSVIQLTPNNRLLWTKTSLELTYTKTGATYRWFITLEMNVPYLYIETLLYIITYTIYKYILHFFTKIGILSLISGLIQHCYWFRITHFIPLDFRRKYKSYSSHLYEDDKMIRVIWAKIPSIHRILNSRRIEYFICM